MASQLGGLIHDQNLSVHYIGASAGGKSNVSKAQRKGGLGGRKPLGDLSNSVMPTPNQSLNKQNSNVFSFTEKDVGASKSKIKFNGSKNKSKAPEKLLTSGGSRKALTDISNSGKLHLHEAPKKNLNAKLGFVAEEHLSAIAEEQFIHNHQECIKARSKAMDIDEFFRTVGLDKGFMKQSVPSQSSKFEPASPPRYLELPELQFGDRSPWKYDQFSDLDSPPPYRTPKSPKHDIQWKDLDQVNFMLIESP
ncbi:Xin actin-binding repeat-containing protein [Melia azedarach]|uniref:Xin actin-binding repeat-containing protein n=1 Tax=Melia azedarach TaxID=155640 RepID=A0ACC1X4V2_MELAZ|nr:Xin actin-binding repeat-containing protein [Melia azedarach]